MTSITKHTIGSNGHKPQYANLRALVFITLFTLSLMIVAMIRYSNNNFVIAYVSSHDKHIVYANESTPKSDSTPTEAIHPYQHVIDYINEVFENDADVAFKLLSCENSTYNPDAVNTEGNTPVGSRDIGTFQISEYWQRTQAKFLFNYKINIEIAHQLFEENDKSFKLWACSKRMGI